MPRASKKLSTTSKRSSNGSRPLGDGRGGFRTRDLSRVKRDRGALPARPPGLPPGRSSVQARDDSVAVVRQSLFAGDRDAILVLRRGSGLPFADLVGPATGLSLVDHGGVAGEQLDDRVDVPLGVGLEIPLDCSWSAAHA